MGKQHSTFFTTETIVTILLIVLLGSLCIKKIIILRGVAQNGLAQKNIELLQDALSVYRGDNEGNCPENLNELLGTYLFKIPSNFGPKGKKSANVLVGNYENTFNGQGGWIYVNDPQDEDYCEVFSNVKN